MQSQSTQNSTALRLSIFAMLSIGLLLLAGALYTVSTTRTWLSRAVEVQGTVVQMQRTTDKDGDVLFKPVVRFSTADGKTVEFHSSFSSNPPVYSVGQSVPVVYMPDEPGRAAIRGFLSLWMGSLVLGVIGAAFFGIGAAMAIASRRGSRALAQAGAAA